MTTSFSGSEIPGMHAMSDTLEFVKKLWGSMQVPGMVAPPMSVDELDKKIQDLKTVESWLSVNMNMLRGTIQALEVQRATLAALQSMGESFAQQAQQASAAMQNGKKPTAPESAPAGGNAAWTMPGAAFKFEPAAPDGAANTADGMPEAGSPFSSPAAWWGLLQNQFKQAVSQAMQGEVKAAEAPAAGEAASAKSAAVDAKKAAVKPAVRARKPAAASVKTARKRSAP